MQEWESLKVILANINREIDRVNSDISRLEGDGMNASREREKLTQQVENIKERANRIEAEAREFKAEVYRMFGENKKTFIAVVLALLGSGAYFGKAEVIKAFGAILGIGNK